MSEPRLRCHGEVTFRDKRQPGTLFGRQCSFAAVDERRPFAGFRPTPSEIANSRWVPVCKRHREAKRLYAAERPERFMAERS